MAWDKTPWAPPLVEPAGGMAGHLLAWERHERDGSWWAWVSWVHEAGGRHDHKVVLVRARSLRPLEPPEACKAVPRRCVASTGRSAVRADHRECKRVLRLLPALLPWL
jgi:hypothetical protein